MVFGDFIQIVSRRVPAFGQPLVVVAPTADPFARSGRPSALGKPGLYALDISDVVLAIHPELIGAVEEHVQVGVDEAGKQRVASEVYDLRLRTAKAQHLLGSTDGADLLAPDGGRLKDTVVGPDRYDFSVDESVVGVHLSRPPRRSVARSAARRSPPT
jgi:hypothetical protein